MAKIKIITDSSCDIPSKLAKKYGIDVIPINIFFGDEKYKDGVSISANDVYKRILKEKNPWPRTSQPSAREFLEYYNKAFDDGYDTVISIHVTANMSGTMNSANLAKQMIPDKDLILVDSNSVTHPFGMFACEIGKLVNNGSNRKNVIETINNKYLNKTQICGVVDTLEYLYRGGRIGRAKKILGSLLKMKPLLHVVDGFVDSFGKAKSYEEAFTRFVNMSPTVFDNLITDSLWLGYAENDSRAKALHDEIKDLPNAPKDIVIHEIGPSVGCHLGPGSLTMSWLGEWNTDWYFGKK